MPLSSSLTTLTEFRDHCARRLGATTYASLGSDDQNVLIDCQAMAMDRITKDADWQFTEDDGEILTGVTAANPTVSLTGDFTAGGASITNVSTNLTTLGATHDDIVNVGEAGFYRLDSASSTTGTLKAGFGGSTGTTTSFTLARDRYNLAAGLIWLYDITEIETRRVIPIISMDEWTQKTAGQYKTGTPKFAMLVGADSTGTEDSTNQRIQLWPIPDAVYTYQYRYKKLPTLTSTNVFTGPHNMDLLIHATMAEVFGLRGDYQAADWHNKKYRELLKPAMQNDVNRSRTGYRAARMFGRAGIYPRRPRYQDPLVE